MIELKLEGFFKSRKQGEQLLKEIGWILQNLAKATTLETKNKWMQKWFNWRKAHPGEADQIEKQIELTAI